MFQVKIGFKCIADCTLEYTNYEQGEEIIICKHCEDHDWPGTEFFENHTWEFESIYEDENPDSENQQFPY